MLITVNAYEALHCLSDKTMEEKKKEEEKKVGSLGLGPAAKNGKK